VGDTICASDADKNFRIFANWLVSYVCLACCISSLS